MRTPEEDDELATRLTWTTFAVCLVLVAVSFLVSCASAPTPHYYTSANGTVYRLAGSDLTVVDRPGLDGTKSQYVSADILCRQTHVALECYDTELRTLDN